MKLPRSAAPRILQNHVYKHVTGRNAFEPTLSRIEQMEYADLWRCAAPIPLDWLEHDGEGLFHLIETLHRRRALVRDLITAFRNSDRHPFPQWTDVRIVRIAAVKDERKPELLFGFTQVNDR